MFQMHNIPQPSAIMYGIREDDMFQPKLPSSNVIVLMI
jgi:hypothetical protein